MTPAVPQGARKKPTQKNKLAGSDPISQLYRAVDRYVRVNGGTVVVIGGIGLIRQSKSQFHIAVKCLGEPPKFPEQSKGGRP